MATLNVVTLKNKKSGSIEMDPTVFEMPVRPDLFHAEVRRQLAARRGGHHSTKNRARVSGGGAKPWRQKGTGNARQGTKRAPQWAGGGVVFGPVPRSYDFSLPKKVRTAALRSALSHRFVDGNIIVVDSLEVGEYKTKRIIEILQGLSLDGCRVLIAIDAPDEHLQRSTRNLPGVQVILVEGLNVFDVLRYEKLLVTKAAVAAIEVRLAGRSKESGS